MRTIKRHDTADPITGIASDDNGPVDLTVFDVVRFQASGGETPILFGGEVEEANADGTWVYQQTDEDVSIPGEYVCELECEMLDGKKIHFPNTASANPTLTIDADLDDA